MVDHQPTERPIANKLPRAPARRKLEVAGVRPSPAELDPMMYDPQAYFSLEPVTAKSTKILCDVLLAKTLSKRTGPGGDRAHFRRWRNKTRPCGRCGSRIQPARGHCLFTNALGNYSLLCAPTIIRRNPPNLFPRCCEQEGPRSNPSELKIFLQLGRLESDEFFNPDRYHDDYQAQLQAFLVQPNSGRRMRLHQPRNPERARPENRRRPLGICWPSWRPA